MKRLLLPLLLLGSGCEELEPFLPKVQFQDLDVNELDFQHMDVDFVFAIDNPNPIDVSLASFSYDLGLQETHLLSGDNADGLQLKSGNGNQLAIPVDLSWTDAWNTVQAVRGEDQVQFGLGGHFGFDTPLGEARVPYDEGGQFPALRTPKFQFRNLRVANFNLLTQTASLELDLGVDNDHGTTLFFDQFDYDVRLNDQPLAAGLINTFDVDGASEKTMTLPIDVNVLTAGATLVDLVFNGGDVDIGLDAGMDVDTPFGIVPLDIDQAGTLNLTP